MTTIAEKHVDNGVNVAALLGAREALGKAPEAARFNWRATCKWMRGTHSRTSVKDFFGLGQEQTHRQTLAVGEHIRMPRLYRGRDIQWWMDAAGALPGSTSPRSIARAASGMNAGSLIRRACT